MVIAEELILCGEEENSRERLYAFPASEQSNQWINTEEEG